jgi:hypothetical protein
MIRNPYAIPGMSCIALQQLVTNGDDLISVSFPYICFAAKSEMTNISIDKYYPIECLLNILQSNRLFFSVPANIALCCYHAKPWVSS